MDTRKEKKRAAARKVQIETLSKKDREAVRS